MAAGPVGSCWKSGSWSATAWVANSWKNAVAPAVQGGSGVGGYIPFEQKHRPTKRDRRPIYPPLDLRPTLADVLRPPTVIQAPAPIDDYSPQIAFIAHALDYLDSDE